MLKLKKYKSCADCRSYEFGRLYVEGFCSLGFPLKKLESPITRSVVIGDPNNDLDYDHKPKFGCVQKNYYGHPKFDFDEARKIASTLNE